MYKLALIACALLSLAQVGLAQERGKETNSLRRDNQPNSASLMPTPEMWFYEQQRSAYLDPKEAVRRNAEARGAERAGRIASSQWFGMSKSRPAASATPLSGSYSPTWGSTSWDPNLWRASRASTVVIVR